MENKEFISEAEFLANYDPGKYEKPSVTVDILVFSMDNDHRTQPNVKPNKALQVLLIKRKNHPYKDCWALPGGFAEMDEHLLDSARRELKEETNLTPTYLGQLYTWGDVGRDPRMRVITTSYLAVISKEHKLEAVANDDASEAQWFSLHCTLEDNHARDKGRGVEYSWYIRLDLTNGDEQLSALIEVVREVQGSTVGITRRVVENDGLAFDHAKIIEYGIEMLRHKIQYTDLAFKLMPEYFTLTELHQVYETILNKRLPKASFRRKMADMVIETERYVKEGNHRPSQLYTFNQHWLDRHLHEGVVDLWS